MYKPVKIGFLAFVLSLVSINMTAVPGSVKLVLRHDSNIIVNNAMVFGLEYTTKKGKTKREGKYFEEKLSI